MCMIISMLMSVVLILYICHLVPSYQVRKALFCCMKYLFEWGTLTSYFLTTLCDNKILICIVINSFITSLPTFVIEYMQDETLVKPTLRSLKHDILKEINTARALVERVLKKLFTTRGHTNLSYVTVSKGVVNCVGPQADILRLLAIFQLLKGVSMVADIHMSHW